jgi:probable rRNA maturation factor
MILNQQHQVRVALRPLESFLRRVQRELGLKPSGMTVCLVSDAGMARLNQDFRRKRGPTDVLSFPTTANRKPLGVRPGMHRHEYWGDIAISPATARRYAKKQKRPLASELRVLILHGVLHLLGYDHESDHGQMDRIERKLRKRFGLT